MRLNIQGCGMDCFTERKRLYSSEVHLKRSSLLNRGYKKYAICLKPVNDERAS